jgi:hypothetical protein
MKLTQLLIQLQPSYADNAGKYTASISYEGERGEVKLLLDPQVSEAVLAVIGPAMTKFSHPISILALDQ